ncbi:MAG: ABC transporter substrate-binding protein [Dehalococcoidia bacterium]
MKRFRILLLSGLVALAAMAVVLSACGDDDDSASSGSAIKLGFSAWPGWFPWQVAEDAGLFKEAGVNVELVWFEGYLDSITALASGQLDANSQTLNDTIGSVAGGADQVIVLVNDNSSGNDQIIVSSEIKTIQDLKGKKVGLEEGVVDHYLLLLGLKAAGMSPSDVEIVNLETGAAASAFAAGQLDAVAVFAPFTTQALKRQGSRTLFSSKDYPGAIPDHLVVSRKLADSRPADVQKLINAWYLTLDYIEKNPDEAIKIMAKRAGVSVEEYKSYGAGTTIFNIDDNKKAFTTGSNLTALDFAGKDISKFMLEAKLIDKEVDLGKLFERKFIDGYSPNAK